jgi:F0F1-type ATP synthase epsilon subunit
MNLKIVSQSGIVSELSSFASVSLMTESGMVTILPHHEPLLSAIQPGILSLTYMGKNDSLHTKEYVLGGGVLNIGPNDCTIIADLVDDAEGITDIEYIRAQKEEAERLVAMYREENSETIDPERLIAIEKDLLRYTLMHELGKKYHDKTSGSRG